MAGVSPDQARYSIEVQSYVTSRYVGTLACAVAVYVPQLALLALLLTSQARVGSFIPLAIVLAASDGLTFYFGTATVLQLWYIGWIETSLINALPPGSAKIDPSAPGFIRWVSEARETTKVDSTWKIVLLLLVLTVFVLGVNVYIGWLWFYP
jgi:hypothetical protein